MPQPNGSKIQQRREELGIHRSALAAQVRLSYQHLYNIENGHKVASIEALWRIANALKLSISDVLIEDGSCGPDARNPAGPEPRRPGGDPIPLPPVKPSGPKPPPEKPNPESRWSA